MLFPSLLRQRQRLQTLTTRNTTTMPTTPDQVVAQACKLGLLGSHAKETEDTLISTTNDDATLLRGIQQKPFAIFYDADAWEENLRELREEALTAPQFLHACAVKTNPLRWFLQRAQALGHGAECASIAEVVHALDCGFAPENIIYDSPCKTVGEIRYALLKKIHLNVDNLQELERVARVVNSVPVSDRSKTIGIRVNPLVGAGSIAAFSVSTGKSKFGLPLPKEGPERKVVLEAVLAHPWISCVHVHTGSGGMGVHQLVAGARTAVDFALEVNAAAGSKQIKVVDIGGGLAINYKTEKRTSTFSEYSKQMKEVVPELFDGKTFERVVTEFGASLQCKYAFLASRVEYTKTYDGGRIALIHAGSELFMRACYCPDSFVSHRVQTYNSDGKAKVCADSDLIPHDIAGPLCFAGDVVVRDVKIPALSVGDIVALADVGGNSLSIHTTHCSRQSPPVYVYRSSSASGKIEFQNLQSIQPVSEALKPWQCLA